MDEAELSAALRGATDDVRVPGDLVRRAERDGRGRRGRRRGAAGALAVTAVVLAGGGIALQQGGASESASPGADLGSSSGSGDAGSSAVEDGASPHRTEAGSGSTRPPDPPAAAGATPESAPDGADAAGPAVGGAGCLPALTVDGVPAGRTVPVLAGASIEVGGATPCGPSGEPYLIVLDATGGPPTVLTEVAPAADGSIGVRAVVPATTAPGSAVLFARGAEERTCPSAAGCPGAVDLDVAAGPPSDRSTEEPP